MRVHLRLGSASEQKEAQEFNEFLLRIGHGLEPVYLSRGEDVIKIPENFVSAAPDLIAFVREIFPALAENIEDKKYLSARAILTSKNDTVDMINELMLGMLPGEASQYLSADSLSEEDDPLLFPPELLNEMTPSGLPTHELNIKVNAPIILMRNLDPSIGACNGTRLTVSRLERHIIDAEIMIGVHAGQRVLIPRTNMSPSESNYAFTMTRRQFPVRLAFAMTINKSQGQTFEKVGIYLPQPVFAHGQLYVAMSRVGAPNDVSIYIENTNQESHCMNTAEGSFTKNVVFREIFQTHSDDML